MALAISILDCIRNSDVPTYIIVEDCERTHIYYPSISPTNKCLYEAFFCVRYLAFNLLLVFIRMFTTNKIYTIFTLFIMTRYQIISSKGQTQLVLTRKPCCDIFSILILFSCTVYYNKRLFKHIVNTIIVSHL